MILFLNYNGCSISIVKNWPNMWNKWTFDDVVKCNNNNHQTVVTLVCEHLLPMYIRWLCMYFNNSIVNKSKWLLAFDASFIWNNNYCCFWCFIVIITYFVTC